MNEEYEKIDTETLVQKLKQDESLRELVAAIVGVCFACMLGAVFVIGQFEYLNESRLRSLESQLETFQQVKADMQDAKLEAQTAKNLAMSLKSQLEKTKQ